jgi:hypothetical protein
LASLHLCSEVREDIFGNLEVCLTSRILHRNLSRYFYRKQ